MKIETINGQTTIRWELYEQAAREDCERAFRTPPLDVDMDIIRARLEAEETRRFWREAVKSRLERLAHISVDPEKLVYNEADKGFRVT